MLDFLMISTRSPKRGVIEILPKFIIKKSNDLMIRGGDFYAVWVEEKGMWSEDEQDCLYLIDQELDKYAEENRQRFGEDVVRVLHMWDASSGMIDSWHKYCQRQMRDNFHMLDERLIFSNTVVTKEDYASKRLDYPLEDGSRTNYDRLMSVLYSEEERHKLEWAIGSVVCGDSKTLQKFVVLYGAAGTGKSTVLNIIQKLFDGYYCVFDAKALGSSNNSFALEAFKSNPLVAIQHDGDLSRIEDNTRLNSLVSHEIMTVNEKFHATYANQFKCLLFMGTNKPVKITDARSGLIRRLIDVSPTGETLSAREYKTVTKNINFELGAIAYHCQEVYLDDPSYYDDYIPVAMMGASNDFFNFMMDSYQIFEESNGTTLKAAWEMYKTYCDEARVAYPFPQRIFKEELKNYFWNYFERYTMDDGTRVRSYYENFRADKFEVFDSRGKKHEPENTPLITFLKQPSIFDKECAMCPAQYATTSGTPHQKWDEVTTCLADLDTSRTHYVKLPENHIVIDFDIPAEGGSKSFEKNLEEASKWPPTYAELSKSGTGIHLHYIYAGDPEKLSRIYSEHVEIKVFTGNSSLRRKLSKCNNLSIATISSGLPLKGEKKMVNSDTIKSEQGLRTMIKRNLNKEIHPGTKPSVDFIKTILDEAYESGLKYDVSDMNPDILAFAAASTNHSDYCIHQVAQMKFVSKDADEAVDSEEPQLIFFDMEVFPNVCFLNYKAEGDEKTMQRLINPTAAQIEDLLRYRLVGFNCRRYDNHILYARMMGYNNQQLYNLSKKIVEGDKNAMFGNAYNLSYADVYDFSSKKQSLKKFEIDLGIHHMELGLPWDQPVTEDQWERVSKYCDNDVISTEAVFHSKQGEADFTAREILADLAGMTVNDTTNSLTTKIIFGNNRHPQDEFNYRNLAGDGNEDFLTFSVDEYSLFDTKGRAIFEGYEYKNGKSTYRGEEVGEGGYVYAEPGMYGNVAQLDISSMHPSSIIAENLFGNEYTSRFKDLVDARIYIKHGNFDKARKMLNGALSKYLEDETIASNLAAALKIAINSVYGLTAANFANPFRDPRNKDNIVAKRGALFMVNLKHAVQDRGFTVVHIKTDSIKIADATPEIIQFVIDYGKKYGYNFEHECTYDRICLVNDAVFVGKYLTVEQGEALYGVDYVRSSADILSKCKKKPGGWTATGTQFQVSYVFKKLFSHEPFIFADFCEMKSVTSGAMYLDLNEGLPDVSDYEKSLSKMESDYKKGLLSDTTFEPQAAALVDEVAKGHSYHFIGKVGQFCPIKPGKGGGLLVREANHKYYSVTGTKGYRWFESEMVEVNERYEDIDISYYENLVNEAVKSICVYGDYEWFVSDDPYKPPVYISDGFMNKPVYPDGVEYD